MTGAQNTLKLHRVQTVKALPLMYEYLCLFSIKYSIVLIVAVFLSLLSFVNICLQRRVLLTFLVSLQDLLQHFKGVGLTRRRAGLPVLLDHLVHLRFLVELLHGKVRARTAVGERNKNMSRVAGFSIFTKIRRRTLGVQLKMYVYERFVSLV